MQRIILCVCSTLTVCLASFRLEAEEPVKTVAVKAGETIADIAERELGDRGRWKDIYALNNIALDKVPAVGQVLKLPPRNGADALLSLVYKTVNHRGPESPDWLPSAAGTGLLRLWRVKTAEESRAEVAFKDSSKLRLDPRAFLIVYSGTASTAQKTLAEPERAKLVEGNLQAFLSKAKSPVAVATPAARLELQPGSHGRMEVDTTAKTATLSVYLGRGSAEAQGSTVAVAAGFASRTTEGAKPGAPTPIPAAPTFAPDSTTDALAWNGTGRLELVWGPITGAAKYRLEVSEEASFTRTVKDLTVDGATRRAVLTLPAGSYLARLSAIDASSITGYPSRVQALWIGKPTLDAVFGKAVVTGEGPDVTVTGAGNVRLRPPAAAQARLSAAVGSAGAVSWQKEIDLAAGTTRVAWTRDGRRGGTVTVSVSPLDLVVSKGAVNGGDAEIRFHIASGEQVAPVPGTVSATLGGTAGTVTRLDGSHFLFRGPAGADDTFVVTLERLGRLTRQKALERRCWSLTALGAGCR